MSNRSNAILKLGMSSLSLVAILVWGVAVGHSTSDALWVVTRFAVPSAALAGALAPPKDGNRYLWAMVVFGLMFALMPDVTSDDDMIQGFLMVGVGLLGCIVSWVLLARQYFVYWQRERT